MCLPNVLLVVSLLGATIVAADDRSDESQAIAKIEMLGGKVTRDESSPGRPMIGVSFQVSNKFDDGCMHTLSALRGLDSLDLFHTQISDAGLKEISGLKNLVTLGLMSTAITDAGLKELPRLTTSGARRLQVQARRNSTPPF
jgi:hypothetical protein